MYLYLLVFIASFLLTYVVKKNAQRHSILDIPNERSSHQIPTPRGGGIAIAIVWFISISFLFYNHHICKDLYYSLLCGILITGISMLDDIYTLKSLPRIIIQVIATILALYFIGGLKKVDLGFYMIENRTILSIIAFIGILWFINLFNFIDGIDGYLATGTIFASLSMFFILGDPLLLIFALIILGFLCWNWQKAKIFMGDSGSTLLGFNIAILAIYYQNNNFISVFMWIILTAIFWFDATITLFRRFQNKEDITTPHKKHAYQRIVQAGFSHQKTVLFSLLLNTFFLIFVFISVKNARFILVSFFLCIICCFFVLKLVDHAKK